MKYITDEQSHAIKGQTSNRDKNGELLCLLGPFDETKFSNFVKCLRQTDQNTVARIIENGGGLKHDLYDNIVCIMILVMHLRRLLDQDRSKTVNNLGSQ